MATKIIKIIVSYDGTENDRDALALGSVLGRAGASLELAYVRHAVASESGSDRLQENDAQELLAQGAAALGAPDTPRHVVLSGSTAEGLRTLALSIDADMIVFGSEYRTAPMHVDPQQTAARLLDGGPVAIGVAPAGFADQGEFAAKTIAAIGEDGDPTARETAESLAGFFGSQVAQKATRDADLIVVGSKPGVVTGRVTISAAAEYLIQLARCPVIVLPRGVALHFGR